MRFIQAIVLVLLFSVSSCSHKSKETEEGKGIVKAEKAGIKLAMQSYTFHKFTLMEALDKTAELGIKYIEVYPGHIIGGKWGEKPFGLELTADECDELKNYAKDKNIEIVACGVFTTADSADWEKLFLLAQKMEFSYITCEPEYEHLDLVEALAEKYNIKVGIHNHPQPSNYWDANILLEKIKDRSPLIGSCSDIGHWKRCGLDQIECLEMLNGRIISIHLKDASPLEFDDNELIDCILGRGVLDVDAIIIELEKQKWNGYLAIEYEANWHDSMEDIKGSIFYYDALASRAFRHHKD